MRPKWGGPPQVTKFWDDLRFPVGAVRGAGAFAPTPTIFMDGVVLAFSTGPNNEAIQFNAQLPHSYKQGSDVLFSN